MKLSTHRRSIGRGALSCGITIAWLLLAGVLAFMCIRVFGDTSAEIGVPALIVAGALIWYFTERRDRNKPEEDA
jgi:hypothetical protein